MINDFLSLFFPRTCYACGNGLLKGENVICTECQHFLPKTNFHLQKDNPVHKIFWGRISIHAATAFLYFRRQSKAQKLLHLLKYHGRQDIGEHLGYLFGLELRKSNLFNDADIIIPVPLHPKKQKKRGYNQSWVICKGIEKSLNKQALDNILIRKAFTTTQTKKDRWNRWKNVETVFDINNPEKINNKHILLVDDVVTTGATLEACASEILKTSSAKVSIACIASPVH